LKSKKIKYLTVIGTLSIISTAYFLHANSYYEKMNSFEDVNKHFKKPNKILKKEVLEVAEEKEELKKPIVATKIVKIPPKISKIEKTPIKKSESIKKDKQVKKRNYLQVDNFGKLSDKSKKILEEMIPTLLSLDDDDYVEVEGHSATQLYTYKTEQNSKQIAMAVQNYLKEKVKNTKVIITTYGDTYPIIDDKKDKRNSRAELKIRRR